MSKPVQVESLPRGRDPRKEAFWRQALERHRQSGLGVRPFCAGQKLAETAFYFWRREIARRDAKARQGRRRPSAFIELRAKACPPMGACPPQAPIEMRWPRGRRLLIRGGCDAALLRVVLAALSKMSSDLEGEPC